MEIGKIRSTKESTVDQIIDIDGKKLFAGITITGLISGIITFLTFWFIDIPKSQVVIKNLEKEKTFEIVNFVLRHDNDTIRNSSVAFLLELGLIDDKTGKLQKMIDEYLVPNWKGYDEFTPLYNQVIDTGNAVNSNTSSTQSNQNDNKPE